ncbi:phage baseplate assembly protein V [Pseudaquabacterium pictum]|uniref:Phage assembly protein n=1 Tax=Pseudaquabacterium pictum TaxID=2315236 RepID=A0A480AZR1_9BURK|nr:phage baseplate assembly protein [Rubrivivax pictus]GCL64308.1 phage assembly protein [Rubrivivax pictus]
MSGALQRAMRPMLQRLQLMIGRAVVLLVNDGSKLQGLQVSLLADEVRDQVERFQNYGFTSHPLPGAEAVAASVAGNRDHVLVIAVDDRRYRLTALQQGEVAIYTDEGDKIVIKRGGTIEVTAATKVVLDTPLVQCTGDVTVAGTVTAGVDVVADGISLVGHRHGGVDTGVGNTGVPV